MAADGPGFDNLQRVLWGHATHPNVGAAVFVGLGCEVMQVARMKSRFGASGAERFHGLTIQDTGGTTKTIARIVEQIHALLPEVNAIAREPVPASELKVALECGGSDGFSGHHRQPGARRRLRPARRPRRHRDPRRDARRSTAPSSCCCAAPSARRWRRS